MNAVIAANFNQICLQEDLLPVYTNIRLHNQAIHHAPETREYRRWLIEHQLRVKKEDISRLRRQLHEAKNTWNSIGTQDNARIQAETILDEEISSS